MVLYIASMLVELDGTPHVFGLVEIAGRQLFMVLNTGTDEMDFIDREAVDAYFGYENHDLLSEAINYLNDIKAEPPFARN